MSAQALDELGLALLALAEALAKEVSPQRFHPPRRPSPRIGMMGWHIDDHEIHDAKVPRALELR